MTTIQANIGKHHYQTELKTFTNSLIADEPLDVGGEDKGFSPTQLLASALGACTSITLRMYADRKKWDLESVNVKVTFERDIEKNTSIIKREISLFGNLTEEEKKRLLQIADQCPIHKTLTNPISISTSFV